MRSHRPSFARSLATGLLALIAFLVLPVSAHAQAGASELPGRVGRLAQIDGKVWLYDEIDRRWIEGWRNQAVTEGDRVGTDRDSRLQLDIGSTELRLSGDTEIGFERLDDDRIVIRLERGSLAVRVRATDVAREIEIQADRVCVRPERIGHYRIDQTLGRTTVTAWRGGLDIDTRDQQLRLDAGRSVELARVGGDATLVSWGGVGEDAFSDWVARDARRDDQMASQPYVSPEMTGADDLRSYGRWERHPEFGMVWVPLHVAADWAPFRYGRWTWQVRWGWTWVDDEPWGFATSHYGRWLDWHGRWVWTPGAYVARPAYAPALVAWIGGGYPGAGVAFGIGVGATVGWLPLAPRDVYVPPFRHPRRYYDRVNQPHLRPGLVPQIPTGPISYGNQGVPRSVTVVPADVLQRRQPVVPARIDPPDVARPGSRPPRAIPPVVHVPGGAVPAPGRGEHQPSRPQVIPVPGGALPGSTGPAFVPSRPAPPARAEAPALPVVPQRPRLPELERASRPEVRVPDPDRPFDSRGAPRPVRPAPPAPNPGADTRVPGLQPPGPPARAMPRPLPTPPPAVPVPPPSVRPVTPAVPRVEPAREAPSEERRARVPEQRADKRDNARERAERQ